MKPVTEEDILNQGRRQLFRSYNLTLHLAVAGGVGLLLGAAALWFSPLFALVALATGGVAFAALKRPEIALLGILTATSSIIFEARLPLVPIGIGSLHIPDLLLLALFSLILLRWLVEPDFKIVRTPLDWPLLAFYGIALLSTFVATLRSSVEIEIARRAIRVVTYYLIFFIVTNLVRDDRQLRFLLRGLYLLATIVAVVMVAQLLLGDSVSFLPGRVETLRTQGIYYQGVTRIVTPGRSLLLVMFITATVALVLDKLRSISLLKFLQWGLLGMALIITFLRSYWAVIGLILLLLAYVVRGRNMWRFIGWGLVVLLMATIVLLSVFAEPESQIARVASATLARLVTLGDSKTLTEDSMQQRYIENEHALRQVVSHPLIGLGLRAKYRPWDPRIDMRGLDAADFDARTQIHNGHLLILVNTGLLGYLCFMCLSITFLVRGFKYWRVIPDPWMSKIVLGFTLAYLGVLIAAVVNSTFLHWFWTPVIGIMMGINEVALRKAGQEGHYLKSGSWHDTREEA